MINILVQRYTYQIQMMKVDGQGPKEDTMIQMIVEAINQSWTLQLMKSSSVMVREIS